MLDSISFTNQLYHHFTSYRFILVILFKLFHVKSSFSVRVGVIICPSTLDSCFFVFFRRP